MHNRIDKTLTATDIQDIAVALKAVQAKIVTGMALTTEEMKKGGWYLSEKAVRFVELALGQAKLKPTDFPSVDLAAFERDIKLIKQLMAIENQIRALQGTLEHNRRILMQDTAEQGSYVYNLLKIMHSAGVGNTVGYTLLKPYMPRTGKMGKPKTETP